MKNKNKYRPFHEVFPVSEAELKEESNVVRQEFNKPYFIVIDEAGEVTKDMYEEN